MTTTRNVLHPVVWLLSQPLHALAWIWHRPDDDFRKVRNVAVIVGAIVLIYTSFATHTILDVLNARGRSNKDLIVQTHELAVQTHELVARIEAQTSPAAQARQTAAINGILQRVDCNTRAAFQDALHQLVGLGIPQAASIDILTKQCKEQIAHQKGATTVPASTSVGTTTTGG